MSASVRRTVTRGMRPLTAVHTNGAAVTCASAPGGAKERSTREASAVSARARAATSATTPTTVLRTATSFPHVALGAMTADILSAHLPGNRVRPLLEAAEDADGIAAFSEAFEQGLADARVRHNHLIAEDNGDVIACAGIAEDGSAELVVHPDRRREGIGEALADAVQGAWPGAGLWAHGNLPGAQALAAKLGLEVDRELLVMGIDVEEIPSGAAELPEGFEACLLYTSDAADE